MSRFCTMLVLMLPVLVATVPAAAQSSREIGEMRLYIQQLEAQVRNLTGENERLRFELRRLQDQAGTGAAADGEAIVRGTINPQGNSSAEQGAAPQDLGTLSVAEDDPLIAGDGAGGESLVTDGLPPVRAEGQADGSGAPLDLSALAGGQQTQTGAAAVTDEQSAPAAVEDPPLTASIAGGPRDEYDLAYGYILTGDFKFAEAHFKAWVDAFPSHALADDARFWLAESQLRQGKHQAAASGFLELHKRVPNNPKGPDTLVKLGVALVGLGEKEAACATFSEVARKYPDATGATMTRVAGEQQRAKC